MTFEPKIREATAKDLLNIQAIINASFPHFYRYFALHSVSDWKEPTLIAMSEADVVGFAKLIAFQVGDKKCGCILWIAVTPACRRRGVGLALAEAGVAWLKLHGAELVFASTQRGNRGALAALGGAGFVRVGFLGLWRRFGWGVFGFYRLIWFVPWEVVLMHF